MSAEIRGEELVKRVFLLAGPQLRAAFLAELQRVGFDLAQYIKTQKLSGQVLRVRTGNLRGSIFSRFTDDGASARVDVGTNVPYGRTHEYGFNLTVTVKEHLRHLKSGKISTVRAHPMRMNIPARPFLRPALEENKASINARLKGALLTAMRELAHGAT